MRQIILDTETTGLDPAQGHRIIEIGCVELVNRRLTQRRFQYYLQPDRPIDPGAIAVHGITNEFLADKPRFADIATEFLDFIRGAELIIHNAAFDVAFISNELRLLAETPAASAAHHQDNTSSLDVSASPIPGVECRILCTLILARQLHPGQKNSLDALCKRYTVDNSQRQWHGALLDAEILADVYLAMTGGQANLLLGSAQDSNGLHQASIRRLDPQRPRLLVTQASPLELLAHTQWLEIIDTASGGQCVWKKIYPDG
ncbi:MAG: DNA polymerase III subunit epsilon [Gammaproteobacteria bacterium]